MESYRTQALLWLAQRASAAVLALCVAVHLATIVYAVQGGLSSAEVLARTRGSAGWLAFYTLFVKGTVLDGWPGWFYAAQRITAEYILSLELLERRLLGASRGAAR